MTTPDDFPAIAIIPCYRGDDLAEGERLLEPLRRFGRRSRTCWGG